MWGLLKPSCVRFVYYTFLCSSVRHIGPNLTHMRALWMRYIRPCLLYLSISRPLARHYILFAACTCPIGRQTERCARNRISRILFAGLYVRSVHCALLCTRDVGSTMFECPWSFGGKEVEGMPVACYPESWAGWTLVILSIVSRLRNTNDIEHGATVGRSACFVPTSTRCRCCGPQWPHAQHTCAPNRLDISRNVCVLIYMCECRTVLMRRDDLANGFTCVRSRSADQVIGSESVRTQAHIRTHPHYINIRRRYTAHGTSA